MRQVAAAGRMSPVTAGRRNEPATTRPRPARIPAVSGHKR